MTTAEQQIAAKILKHNGLSAAKLGLRFDKVVLRITDGLKAIEQLRNLKGEIVLVALTAPIRNPAKTAIRIQQEIIEYLQGDDRKKDFTGTFFENNVRLRIVKSSRPDASKLLCFVHNQSTLSSDLLDTVMTLVNL